MTISADFLLINGIILTMDEKMAIYEPGAIAIGGDSILAVGPQDEIIQSIQANETIDCGGKVVMPGLINAHTHVPMTLLRGLADDLRLDVWLMGYMMPVEREFVSPDFVRLGTLLACAEKALTMADRIAVLNRGRIVQIGPPEDIYDRPATTFVAQLVGTPRINLVKILAGRWHDLYRKK